jgi:Bacterial Ig domain
MGKTLFINLVALFTVSILFSVGCSKAPSQEASRNIASENTDPEVLASAPNSLLSDVMERFRFPWHFHSRTVVIRATATDSVGVAKVDFYVNKTLTCSVPQAPYNCSWQVPRGTGVKYELHTVAYNTQGKIGVSNAVEVTSQ